MPPARSTLTFLTLLALAAPARGAEYWVRPGGDDMAGGTSPASAWATLVHAASAVGPGDTVHVEDGDYQGFDLRTAGTPGNPITFVAEGSSARITADNPRTPDGINVEDAAWIVLDGFDVEGRSRAGIRVAVSSFVTVRRCRAGNNGHWGIFSGFADDFTIEDNEAWGSVLEHGIYVSNSGDRPVIRRNHVHDNHANGIHMNGDASQGGDGVISGALVEENVIHGNGAGGGSGINMDGVADSLIQNNLLYDNHASGISLYRIDAATGSHDDVVVNNTIVNAADARWCVNINTGSTGNVVRDNVLLNLHPTHGAIAIDASSRAGFAADHNAETARFSINGGATVIDLAGWQALGYDAGSFATTPAALFLVPGSDFHLLPGAPAVDAGSAAGAPARDLDGNPRPVGAAVDIGAYELQLVHCGDGTVDPGEQCGEPGLACADPCTTCLGCVCAARPALCGDGVVCGGETCESDAECAEGETCSSCRCENAPACSSGISLHKPSLRLVANPLSLRFKGEALIPKPWAGVDPATRGIRLVADSVTGSGGIDVTLPGGAQWTTNTSRTKWVYADATGSAGGVTKAVVLDRSNREDGLLRFTVKGGGGTIVLPPVDAARTAVILGAPAECAAVAWGGPADVPPRCRGDATRLKCR